MCLNHEMVKDAPTYNSYLSKRKIFPRKLSIKKRFYVQNKENVQGLCFYQQFNSVQRGLNLEGVKNRKIMLHMDGNVDKKFKPYIYNTK